MLYICLPESALAMMVNISTLDPYTYCWQLFVSDEKTRLDGYLFPQLL